MGLGGGGRLFWGGAGVELVISKLKLGPRLAIRWPGAGSAVSVDQRVASRDVCRNGYRPVTLLLSMLSSLSKQLLKEKNTIMALSTKNIRSSLHGIYNERH